MKEILDDKNIFSLVTYRIQRAKDTLAEAEILNDNRFYNAAVNRLYYACYYAVIALLVRQHIAAQTHAGVKQMFGLHFIATGKLAPQLGRFYSQLFNDRMSDDYDDFVTCDADLLNDLLPKAKEFIHKIEAEVFNQDITDPQL